MKIKGQMMGNGGVIYEGRIYPAPNDPINQTESFNPDKWLAFWKSKAEEIKKAKLSYDQIYKIHRELSHEIFQYGYHKNMITKHQETNQTIAELTIAFELSYSNYRDSKGKFLSFFMGFFARQIKDLPRIKNKS